jgi:ribosomal protein S3AE
MAKGKNKQLSKRGGGRGGKTEKHAFAKKKWYKLQTPPTIGPSVNVGWVPVNKTIGTKLSKDGLLGRVAEVNLADVQDKCSCPWKRVKMQIEEVKSSSCYTSWYGLSMINEKLYTFLRKKMTLIDVVADVKTQDGYILRCLVTTFTSRKQGQLRTNTYAKASQVRAIRKAFVKYLAKVAVTSTISDFAASVIGESMANKLMERGKKIFPLSTVLVRKQN